MVPSAEKEDEENIGSDDPSDEEDQPAPAAAHGVHSATRISKLRANASDGRRKPIQLQKVKKKELRPLMWLRMSTWSKSKVREEAGFESVRLRLDSVKLWEYIRRSHLTHIYVDDDLLCAVNIQEQTIRYNYLRQGDREIISASAASTKAWL